MIRLVGEAGWVGLRIHGEVLSGGCLSVGFVNQLTSDSVFLRSEDWVIHRDARIEHATLSGGGLTCKSDIRINLADKGSECAVVLLFMGVKKDMMTIILKFIMLRQTRIQRWSPMLHAMVHPEALELVLP